MATKLTRLAPGAAVVAILWCGLAGAEDGASTARDATGATPAGDRPEAAQVAAADRSALPREQAAAVRDSAKPGPGSGDVAITEQVMAALSADQRVPSDEITVTTTKGVVALSGTVRTADQKQLAERLSMQVAGVVKVENRLEVTEG